MEFRVQLSPRHQDLDQVPSPAPALAMPQLTSGLSLTCSQGFIIQEVVVMTVVAVRRRDGGRKLLGLWLFPPAFSLFLSPSLSLSLFLLSFLPSLPPSSFPSFFPSFLSLSPDCLPFVFLTLIYLLKVRVAEKEGDRVMLHLLAHPSAVHCG